jgi:Glycosyl transferases group 1/Glycosyl transferase family 2/Tetratricopeptide repeat
MRVLIRAYDVDDLGGSAVTLRAVARHLESRGDTVWATSAHQSIADVRVWQPDIIVGQQWATGEASEWATTLHVPFVMFVHGPGQYEYFRPQCDLVVFNSIAQLALARLALGRTPSVVLHPPVFRDDYETPGEGTRITFVGTGPGKGQQVAMALARELPSVPFLFVTDDELADSPPNIEITPRTGDMKHVYARTRLLLVPSCYESYGRVVVEAAMSGIPSVVSDVSGLREATAGLATFVGAGQSWSEAVAQALTTIDQRRADARRLAALRDPSSELGDLRERLCTIATEGRRPPTLTLCMTVGNEGATLEQAVRSVEDVVDEIVIGIDTRSTDDTGAIARRLATRCFEYTEASPPDFPRMRNRAMELVDTDWAIVLDGHEWIEHAHLIPRALETTAWSIEIQTLYEPDAQRIPGLSFPFPRIHRRHVRFGGAAAHEEVTTPCERRSSRLDIKVWHERKPGVAATARSAEKTDAELLVLRDAWRQRGDTRALFYLANGLREAGRHAEAIEAYDAYLRVSRFAEEAWQARLYLARCRAALGEWSTAQQAFEQAVVMAPERAEASVGLGHALLAQGDARRAAAWFRMATGLPEPRHCRMFVEVPLYRWGAWHGLALALDRLGDSSGAAEAERSAAERGAGEWARENAAMWRARADSVQS